MTLLLFIYTHLGTNTLIQCACGCERSVSITEDRCCHCGNVMLVEHMDNSLNQTCTTCVVTNYERESLSRETSIRVTEIVSIQGLYKFFQSWAKKTLQSTKGSDEPDDVVDFLTTTVLEHKEFTGTSIMKI